MSLIFSLSLCSASMPRHQQPSKPHRHQPKPLCQYGEDVQKLHRGVGEPGDHVHGGAPGSVLPQGKRHWMILASLVQSWLKLLTRLPKLHRHCGGTTRTHTQCGEDSQPRTYQVGVQESIFCWRRIEVSD